MHVTRTERKIHTHGHRSCTSLLRRDHDRVATRVPPVVSYTGLIVATAFGNIRKLNSWPTPLSQPKAKPEPTQKSGSSDRNRQGQEGSSPSPAPELQIERSQAQTFYNFKVAAPENIHRCANIYGRSSRGRHAVVKGRVLAKIIK